MAPAAPLTEYNIKKGNLIRRPLLRQRAKPGLIYYQALLECREAWVVRAPKLKFPYIYSRKITS